MGSQAEKHGSRGVVGQAWGRGQLLLVNQLQLLARELAKGCYHAVLACWVDALFAVRQLWLIGMGCMRAWPALMLILDTKK